MHTLDAVQCCLNFSRINVDAAGNHHVSFAIADKHVSIRIEIADITGGDEAGAIDLAAFFGLVVIGEIRIAFDPRINLADLALRQRLAARLGRAEPDCVALIADARARLFAARETRVRPGRDDKVLTSWNALTIDAMAFAARVFGEPRWADSARRALDFVRSALWRNGRLLATHKDGRSHLNAYLDDHAFLLGAVLEVMQGDTLRADDLQFACALAELLLEQFEDSRDGGFYFTSHDHEALVLRPKTGFDGATASGNGVAALQLQRLGHLIGEPRYLQAAQRTMALFAAEVQRTPQGYATLASAMSEWLAPPTLVMLAGPSAALVPWRAELARQVLPSTLLLHIPEDAGGLPETLAKPLGADPQAWVCCGPKCLPPITDLEALLAALTDPEAER